MAEANPRQARLLPEVQAAELGHPVAGCRQASEEEGRGGQEEGEEGVKKLLGAVESLVGVAESHERRIAGLEDKS
jgi:hypothetical protein